jgi:hypothetical protein
MDGAWSVYNFECSQYYKCRCAMAGGGMFEENKIQKLEYMQLLYLGLCLSVLDCPARYHGHAYAKLRLLAAMP